MVLSSSSALYLGLSGGEDNGEYGMEEAYPHPNNVYSANKQAAEDLGRAYQNTFGLDVVAVRYGAVFGPWKAGGGGMATTAMERWLRTAMAGQPSEVDLGGADWVYSKDAAQGTHRACWAENLETRIFNLAMGRAYSAQDVADAINKAIPGNLATAPNSKPHVGPIMSIDRAKKQLGYEVEFPMEAAVADYRDWIAGPGSQSGAR